MLKFISNLVFASSVALALLVSTSAWAHGGASSQQHLAESKVLYAAAEAMAVFATDFPALKGKPLKDEFVGVTAALSNDEAEVGVYHITAPQQLSTVVYGCHFHMKADGQVEDAHCHFENTQAPVAYRETRRFFTIDNFKTALNEAAAQFEATHGALSSISILKMWQNSSGMELVLGHGASAQKAFYMCHFHGAAIDCHEKVKSGSGEPN